MKHLTVRAIILNTIICAALLASSAQAQFVLSERIAGIADWPEDEPDIGLALDTNDNCYVTGFFDGTNDFGGITLTNESVGGPDMFVAKYNATGTLQWVQRAGGTSVNYGRGIGVDTNGNVYATGGYSGSAKFGSINLTAPSGEEFFLAKYNNAGAVQWVKSSTGGSDNVYGIGLTVDGAGNSYALVVVDDLSGDATSVTFGSTTVLIPDGSGGPVTILVKYGNTGTAQWAQLMGGSDEVYATRLVVDAVGNVYVHGTFFSTLTIGNSNLVVSADSTQNMFIAKFGNSGTLTWVQQPQGTSGEGGVAVDQAENVYVTGAFDSNLDFGGGISLTNAAPNALFGDPFVAKYNSSGAIQWAQPAGGTSGGLYWDIALDAQTNIYAAGYLGSDAAIAKYNSAGTLQWTKSASGSSASPVASLVSKCALDPKGNCYLTGFYQGTNSFGTNTLQPQETWNIFLAELPSNTVANPTIQFTASPTSGAPPLTVQFNSPSVDSFGSNVVSWNWNFGDGATSTLQNPSHTYSSAGTFAPDLLVTNSSGLMVQGTGPAITASSPNSDLVQNGGFETGDFTGWNPSGDTSYTFVDDGSESGITPYSGSHETALGTSGSFGYLSQTLSTVAGQSYLLSFWFNNSYVDPGEFLVSWNGETLLDAVNPDADDWTNIQFMVTATGTHTVLQFGFQDDDDYFGLDDISVVASQPRPLVVSTTSLPNGTNGVAYNQTLTASGGQTPYSWTNISGALPSGFTLAATGLISGTPTINGTFNFTVKVTDALSSTATQTLILKILAVVGPPSIDWIQPTNNSVTVVVGNNMSLAVSAAGTGPFSYQWQLNGTNLPNGIITTVAGNGKTGYSGDGGPATNAEFFLPYGVAVDAVGNLFIADFYNNRVRRVGTNGIITTVAGNGSNYYTGDGGPATNAEMNGPAGLALDTTGNLFIADVGDNVIRKVGTNGIITTVAGTGYGAGTGGTGNGGYSGDGGAATNAELNGPNFVALDAIGNLFISDAENQRVRKVETNGVITTVAGNGIRGYSGDGDAATNAELTSPVGLALDATGNLFIADIYNLRIRKVDKNGIITTVAGNGTYPPGFSGDGGAATNAELYDPYGLALDATGNLFIGDSENQRIRKMGTNETITTVAGNGYGAGTGNGGYSGDDGAATNAELNSPEDVAVDVTGNLFIADVENQRIRKVAFQGPTLALNNVGFGNAGIYDVVVSNPYGSITSSVVNVTVTLPPVILSTPQITGGSINFTFLLSGPAGSNYVLQVSTNLFNWSPVSTSTIPVSGTIPVSNAISGYNNRFYRAYLQ